MISTGKGAGEVRNGVEVVRSVQRIEQADDDRTDHRLEGSDGAGREHPTDQGPEQVVFRWIHHDDAAEAGDELRILRER